MARWLMVLLAVGLAFVAGLRLARREPAPLFERYTPEPGETAEAPASLPKLWPIPDFSLTERSGRTVTLAELKGKVWVADLIYTTCPGPCPLLSTRMSEIQRAVADSPQVRLVSISSDPEADTPEVLQKYAQTYHAGERWFFLTGAKAEIYRLCNEGFKLGLSEDANSAAADRITHSTKLVLVDRQGYARGFYEGTGGDARKLLTDLRRLQIE